MEEKKRLPVHKVFVKLMGSKMVAAREIVFIAEVYGEDDAVCPPEDIPELIAALKEASKGLPHIDGFIDKAIEKLLAQLKEYEAEEKKKNPPDACPVCGGKLVKVFQPESSPLNEFQWAAERRGDFRCKGECGKFFFFTKGELKPGHND
jgi:hypothetical protein